MLESATITGFKSIKRLTVDLAPLVVIFGPNATGKSNLLEALLLASRLVTERTAAAAFDFPVRGYAGEAFTLPAGGLQGLLAQQHAELAFDLKVAALGESKPLQYRVEVQIQPATGELRVVDEFLARLDAEGEPSHLPRIEKDGDDLLIRKRNRPGRPIKLELGQNHTVLSNLQYTGSNYPDFDVLRREFSAWWVYYLDPRDAMRKAQPPREVEGIGSRGEFIAPFLYRLKRSEAHQANFRAIGRALRAAIPSMKRLDVDLDTKRGILDVQLEQDGVSLSSRIVSEGTLRVLALCAIAANPWPERMIAFEEPENGVHPKRIEVIARILANIAATKGRQVVVTTHSPTFVGEMLKLKRERPGIVRLLSVKRGSNGTSVSEFGDRGTLFSDVEVRSALQAADDATLLGSMLNRGWFDG